MLRGKDLYESRIGEIGLNKQGLSMEIIEYNHHTNILVKFEDGTIKKASYGNFKTGSVKNKNHKFLLNIGYNTEHTYKASVKGKPTREYDVWRKMIIRCYDKKHHVKQPTYKDAEVCKEWCDFQNFAKWYKDNYYIVSDCSEKDMHIDKDILFKNNHVYSPDTCVFVPRIINNLFTKRQNDRGNSLIGTHYLRGKYQANCNNPFEKGNKGSYLGFFDTEEEAYQTYKITKEKYIKNVANKYKEEIPNKLYVALMKYEVSKDD